jgi:hypothetical protein
MATAFAYSERYQPPTAETAEADIRRELEERFRQLPELWSKDRVEIIHDRNMVSPVPTWVHERIFLVCFAG